MGQKIKGVDVTIDHPSIKNAKTVEDLAKLGIFNHLPSDEEKDANAELWAIVHPPKKTGSKPEDSPE